MAQHSARPAAHATTPAGPALRRTTPLAAPSLPARFLAPVVGRLVRCGPGSPLVDFADNPLGTPVAARTTTTLDQSAVGGEVVLLFEDGDPARPIVVGVVRPADATAGVPAEVDGERVLITAEREIVLRCGEASITLTRAGKVLIRGTYVLSRSSGANRIKGATVGDQLTMSKVQNFTPFTATGSWTRGRDGGEVRLIAVRCTFSINSDGTTSVADEQDPEVLAPKYREDSATSSLLYDSDFYLTKPTTDVLLHGHAYAPGGEPAQQVDVTMRVGDVRKSLRVSGDRRSVTRKSAEPFTRIPLTYERSYGGCEPGLARDPDRPRFEPRNPVGTGFLSGTPTPNVEYQGVNLTSRPAGFGPIPPHWQPRVRYAGTFDATWQRDRCPLYPDDLDDRYFLCSPEDQRPGEFLRGGEPVELLNLTPNGRLAFTLPRVAFGFETVFRDGDRVRHRGRLYTVILEPDVPRVILVWRTELPCHARALKLQRTTVRQKQVLNVSAAARAKDRR